MNRLSNKILNATTIAYSSSEQIHSNLPTNIASVDILNKIETATGHSPNDATNDTRLVDKFKTQTTTSSSRDNISPSNYYDNNNSGHINLLRNSSDLNGIVHFEHHYSNKTIGSYNLTSKMNISDTLAQHNNPTQLNGIGGIGANATGNTSSDWFEMPRLDNLTDVFSFCCSTAVILGGLVPYIPQYLQIKKSGSSEGFSTYVCLTLLLANILRIAFWFGHHFELPLLIQSFVMIAGMLAMMEICVRVKSKSLLYTISGISGRSTRSRQAAIGKISHDLSNSDDINELNNESTPIYSVTSSSESSSSPSPTARSALLAISTTTEPAATSMTPYHQQEHSEIESSRNGVYTEQSRQYDSNNVANSFRDIESPILSNILESTTIQDGPDHLEQYISSESQSVNHSYSNGYISKQRRQRLAIYKWLRSRFWNWDDLFSYVKFLSLFTIVVSLLTYLLLDNHSYVETLGFVAVFTESMLGLPQLIRNYVKKSTRGMSVEMVIMWLSGDLFKTLYFILRQAPVQFVVCGGLQVTVDILILIQVFWFRRRNVTYSKLPKST